MGGYHQVDGLRLCRYLDALRLQVTLELGNDNEYNTKRSKMRKGLNIMPLTHIVIVPASLADPITRLGHH